MIVYLCGYNGFKQITDHCSNSIQSQFRRIPVDDVSEVDFSWSCVIAIAGSDIYLSGCLGNVPFCLKKLIKPNEFLEFSKVACHESYALFITNKGECWQFFYHGQYWRKLINFCTVEEGTSSNSSGKYTESVADNLKSSSTQTNDTQQNIIKICCGEILNVALDNRGVAYSIPSPITLPGIIIKDVACGFEHCLMLDELGRVFSLGSGMRGQLGHEVLETTDVPQEIDALGGLKVIRIAAGGWHSAAITSSGILYTWGWNNSGQLGFPAVKADSVSTFHHKDEESKDCDMKCKARGMFQNSDLIAEDTHQFKNVEENKDDTFSGKNWKKIKLCTPTQMSNSTGEDSYKVGEMKEPVTVLAVPQPVSFPCQPEVDVVDVSCGNRHTVTLTSDGSLWGSGWNAYCQLGVSPNVMISSDTFIKLHLPTEKTKIIKIHCAGWNTAVFFDEKS